MLKLSITCCNVFTGILLENLNYPALEFECTVLAKLVRKKPAANDVLNSMKEGHGFCAPKVTTFPGIQKKIITMNLNSPSHHLLFRMNSHRGLCPKTNHHKSDGNVVWSFNFILLQYSMDFEGSDHIRKVVISAVKQISTHQCCVAL